MVARPRRTYRNVDGERVEGTWRHIFTRNGDTYYLADLIVYADGAIDCGVGGLTDLHGLRRYLHSGRVATTLQDGSRASAHHVASWRFAEPDTWIDVDMLLGEVADDLDFLNGRPDSSERCLLAVEAYLADPTEDNRLAVRDRYLAIPEHLRIYALGDMDARDWPLRVLATPVGAHLDADPDEEVVTAEVLATAVEYFRNRNLAVAARETHTPADGAERAQTATLTIYRGRQEHPGTEVLQNGWPAAITINRRDYPSVTHAYWALSTGDPDWHDRIAAAPNGDDAATLADEAPRRVGWPAARLAVMAALLRAKYLQHPQMAQTLLATGDARIIYADLGSSYWVARSQHGTNWIGRLLEVIRSELAAAQAGMPLPATHDTGPSASP